MRVAADLRKSRRLRRCLGLEAASEVRDPSGDPERSAQREEAQRMVYRVLDTMSEKRRTVFILYELQGMDGPEIAASRR